MRLNYALLLLPLLFSGCAAEKRPEPPKPLTAEEQAKLKREDELKKAKLAFEAIPAWDKRPYPYGAQTYRPTKGYYRIVVLHTNDLHGQVLPGVAGWAVVKPPRKPGEPAIVDDQKAAPRRGGLAILATAIKEIRQRSLKAGKGFLLLDAGDLFTGTPEGTISRGDVIIDYMNHVGYDALTVGHSDYDLGGANLRRLAQRAQFPFLGANVLDARQGSNPEFIQPYVIKKVGPFRVAILGLLTSRINQLSARAKASGHTFAAVRPTLERIIPQLEKQQVDLLIVLSHLGVKGDAAVAEYLRGCAAIIGGHAHIGLSQGQVLADQGVRAVTWGQGTSLGWVELVVSLRTRKLLEAKAHLVNLSRRFFEPDQAVSALVSKTVRLAQAKFGQRIGRTTRALKRRNVIGSSALGNVFVDGVRQESGAQIALLSKRHFQQDIAAGPITLRSLHEVWPTNDPLVRMILTGRQLTTLIEHSIRSPEQVLEVSGLRVTYDPQRPAGNRLTSLEHLGRPIDPARDYRVVTTKPLADGGEGHKQFLGGRNPELIGMLIHTALQRYVATQSPLDRPFEERIIGQRAGSRPKRVKLAVLLASAGPEAALFNQALQTALERAEKRSEVETRVETPEAGGNLAEELGLRSRRGQYQAIVVVGRAYGEILKKLAPKHPRTQFIWVAIGGGQIVLPNVSVFSYDLSAAIEQAGRQAVGLRPGGKLGLLAVASQPEAARLFASFSKGYGAGQPLKRIVTPAQEMASDRAGALAQARRLIEKDRCTVLLAYAGLTAARIQALAKQHDVIAVGLGQGRIQLRIEANKLVRRLLEIARAGKALAPQQRKLGNGVVVERIKQ